MFLLELMKAEERANSRRESGIGRRAVGEEEVGAGVGAAEEAGRRVVGAGGLLGRLEGAEPHPDLLGRALYLRDPSPRRALANAHEFRRRGIGGGGGGSSGGFLGFERTPPLRFSCFRDNWDMISIGVMRVVVKVLV